MELNGEQIIKALECCGEMRECSTCPRYDRNNDLCEEDLHADTLSLIKELTAENKLLNVELGNANSEILRLIDREKELTEENERLKQLLDYKCLYGYDGEVMEYCVQGPCPHYEIKKEFVVDTVRKMQERLKEYFPYDADSGLYVVLDQIAKEMLEE